MIHKGPVGPDPDSLDSRQGRSGFELAESLEGGREPAETAGPSSGRAISVALPTLDDRPREECGVVGISGVENASEMAFLGLYALQHRGQEAAGIVAVKDGEARMHKGLGLVADIFNADTINRLDGSVAIGHVRYSTAGGGGARNAQPIVVRYAEGDLAVAHNGNLTNAHDLRTWLVKEGSIFQSSNDSEVMVHLVARSRHESVDAQIDDALTHLEGAFSMVVSVGDTLYAARDPRGFRPLVLGRLGEGHVVAYFARPDSKLWGVSVDRARRAFGRQLAREHPVEADCVIAVPDSANSAALGYAEESGIPFELGLLRNHYVGRTFIKPSQADRDFGARMKYNPVREVIAGKRVIVVDDSLVRGTTSRSLAKFFREAGAQEVHFRIASPPVRFPCFYGIDMPSRAELIGSDHSVEEIRKELEVNSLGYLSQEGMEDAVKEAGPFCSACFSGDYPAPLVDVDKGFVTGNPRC
jgi:amidophosphoribosyltransferase